MGINYFRLKIGTDTTTEYLIDNDCRLAKNYEGTVEKVYLDDCTESGTLSLTVGTSNPTTVGFKLWEKVEEGGYYGYAFDIVLGSSNICATYTDCYEDEYGYRSIVTYNYNNQFRLGGYQNYGLNIYRATGSGSDDIYQVMDNAFYNDNVSYYAFIVDGECANYGISLSLLAKIRVGYDSTKGYYFYVANSY